MSRKVEGKHRRNNDSRAGQQRQRSSFAFYFPSLWEGIEGRV
jgi:hypothetical protein